MRWPAGRGIVAALVEDLHDDRRRGQHETHAGDEGDERAESRRAMPTIVSSSAQTTTCSGAQAEDLAPQAPQPRRLHLEPDDEQEHHDAELGDMQDRLRIV